MKKNGKTSRIKNKVMYVLSGSVLTEDFFVKNTLFIGVVLFLMVLYISNRYTCIEQTRKIEALQKELKDAKYEYQTISSQLTAISRQSQVIDRVEKDQLGLEMSNRPNYEIDLDTTARADSLAKVAEAKKIEEAKVQTNKGE